MPDVGDVEDPAGPVPDHLVDSLDGAVGALGHGGRPDVGPDLDPLALPVATDGVVADDPSALPAVGPVDGR